MNIGFFYVKFALVGFDIQCGNHEKRIINCQKMKHVLPK